MKILIINVKLINSQCNSFIFVLCDFPLSPLSLFSTYFRVHIVSLRHTFFLVVLVVLSTLNLFKICKQEKRKTHPAISVNKISGFVQIYSTVGERVPICLRSTLLNTWATSFLPSKSMRFKF